AAANVQRPLAGLRAGQFEDTPLPKSVQPKTLKIIDQVITRSDAAKKVLHPGRSLAAWNEESLGHAETRVSNLAKAATASAQGPRTRQPPTWPELDWNVFCFQSADGLRKRHLAGTALETGCNSVWRAHNRADQTRYLGSVGKDFFGCPSDGQCSNG